MLPLVVGILAASAVFGQTTPPPVVVLAQPGPPNLEQQLVHQALVQQVLAVPGGDVIDQAPLPASVRRASALRSRGNDHLQAARHQLRALQPEAAAALAGMASRKFARLAILAGDVGPLQQSLALEAAAHLHGGTVLAAQRALAELFALQPHWRPDVALFNPSMQQTVERERIAYLARPTRRVHLRSTTHATAAISKAPSNTASSASGSLGSTGTSAALSPPATASTAASSTASTGATAALFVDGTFAGFAEADVELTVGVPHYVWTLPSEGEGSGDRVVCSVAGHDAPLEVALLPRQAPALHGVAASFTSVFAAAAAREGFAEPSLPILAASGAREVLVLSYRDGTLRLVHFDLVLGHRRVREQPAIITQLEEAQQAARLLVSG